MIADSNSLAMDANVEKLVFARIGISHLLILFYSDDYIGVGDVFYFLLLAFPSLEYRTDS